MSIWLEKADRVLVDAPCTGLGIIRKKPDIKWKKDMDSNEITKLQLSIINTASNYVKKGGTLVYSTCTITPDENQEIVNGFLKKNSDFELDYITKFIPEEFRGYIENKGMIQLYPNRDGTDGFFIARMKKVES